tara:strand:- start:532 stop:1617 length:1086 start_codon:yes stop_codon:yes gene_type:complete
MSRRDIYYWKCDRPAAFHGTAPRNEDAGVSEEQLRVALTEHFQPAKLAFRPSSSQGNHLTWIVEMDGETGFLRVENGPEGDQHLEIESAVLGEVAAREIPVPRVLGCDASRTKAPFAWQLLEFLPEPDLNQWAKQDALDENTVAYEIGQNVARWQKIRPPGFGPFQLATWQREGQLRGWHETYADYFNLRLDRHLDFLVKDDFLTKTRRDEIASVVEDHADHLNLTEGCLVHKDLALWNVIGTPDHVTAFIDFDDAISGDPMDDLSLLACFHDRAFLERAFAGYESEAALPDDAMPRFWLHLLRNLIVKAVIRVGAGYFRRDSGFFLIGSGCSGGDLRTFTEARLATALHGLRSQADLSLL